MNNSSSSNILQFEKDVSSIDALSLVSALKKNLSDGYCLTDEEGIILDVNDVFCNSLEYSQEEVLGKNFTEFLPQGMRPYALMLHHEYISAQSEENAAEWAFETKSGQDLLLRSSTSRLDLAQRSYKLEIFQKVTQSTSQEQESIKKLMHQFKNTLQEISGLLQLQAVQLEGLAKQEVLNAQKRSSAIAIAFELLYKGDSKDHIHLEDYLNRLLVHFEQDCELSFPDAVVSWPVDRAYALGIIITESINSIAESEAQSSLLFHVNVLADEFALEIKSEQNVMEVSYSKFSQQLIKALSRQLQATTDLQAPGLLLGLRCPL